MKKYRNFDKEEHYEFDVDTVSANLNFLTSGQVSKRQHYMFKKKFMYQN